MSNEKKMTAEQRLRREMERNDAELRKAEERRKKLKEVQRTLEKKAYENRLMTRAKMLEEFLIEPDVLTNDDVREYLTYLFTFPANQQRLQRMIDNRKAAQSATE